MHNRDYYIRNSKIGNLHLSSIKRIHIIELYKYLLEEKDYSTSTVHNIHVTLYGALQDALEDGMLVANPAEKTFSKLDKKESKTKSGIREIPLVMELRKQLLRKKEYDKALKINGSMEIDGYTDFVFHTRSGKPYTEPSINPIFDNWRKI